MRPEPGKGRVEAFSDGDFAIVVTIMVLELKLPDGIGGPALAAFAPLPERRAAR